MNMRSLKNFDKDNKFIKKDDSQSSYLKLEIDPNKQTEADMTFTWKITEVISDSKVGLEIKFTDPAVIS